MSTVEHSYADRAPGESPGRGGITGDVTPADPAPGAAAGSDGFDLDVRTGPVPGTEGGLRKLFGEDDRRPMKSGPGRSLRYEYGPDFLVRAAPFSDLELPPWPDLERSGPGDAAGWCAWMRTVWSISTVAEAVRHASPDLAGEVDQLAHGIVPPVKGARSMCLSLIAYLLRLTTRPTPFGLCAGVAQGAFGQQSAVRWGSGHRAVARAGGVWLADVVARLEQTSEVRERLPVMLNNTAVVRGDRLVVPFTVRPWGRKSTGVDEVSLSLTAPVRSVLGLAQDPVVYRVLADKLSAEYPAAGGKAVRGLLDRLIDARVLITSLQPPSTVIDVLGHVLAQLNQVQATDVPAAAESVGALRGIHGLMGEHSRRRVDDTAGVRGQLVRQMTALSEAASPLALDMRLDCDVRLPHAVAEEAAAAVAVLTRVSSHPYGTLAWRDYHQRFLDRYGPHAPVPVGDLLDPAIGLGLPHGYLGAGPVPKEPASARDRRLLALAQLAALEGQREIILDEQLISDLTTGDPSRMRTPAHLEVMAEVHAKSQEALQRGRFDLVLSGLTRGQGTVSGGRFAALLDPSGRDGVPAALAGLPTSAPDAVPAQLAFPSLAARAAHLARTPELLPRVISLAEHRAPNPGLIQPSDLAVAADHLGLYLMSLTHRTRIEPAVLHPLEVESHTPVLARFLSEVTRAGTTAITNAHRCPPFDWGAAAHLPYLPRVRYRRTVLAPARWTLSQGDLPGRDATGAEWATVLAHVRERRNIPPTVLLKFWDQAPRLDLTIPAHRAFLRSELDTAKDGPLILTEASAPDAYQWCGGHPHEIVTLLRAQNNQQLATPLPTTGPVRRDHGHWPGTSPYLSARIPLPPTSESRHQLLAHHLEELADTIRPPGGSGPHWWFTTEEHHLLLTTPLPSAEFHGLHTRSVSNWAKKLAQDGLLRGGDLELLTYRPRTGLWGEKNQHTAAEAVFAADTQAALRQLAEPRRPDTRALAAANFTAIAADYLANPNDANQWLIQHLTTTPTVPGPPRHLSDEAIHLANPTDQWKHLRSHPAGPGVTAGWANRRHALRAYRTLLSPDADHTLILNTLIHDHHNRAHGPDPEHEAVSRRLARSAALSRIHRDTST